MTTSWDDLLDRLRVEPGEAVQLSKRATDDDFGLSKQEALAELESTTADIDLLQQRLFAENPC
ncbi:MAG: hypothetical protein FD127_3672 [Acidimicrobiaceae bacterium]|nr:MAG: hypothetical protein FD127_3672 [Acidimicrobiaceae bacterium]